MTGGSAISPGHPVLLSALPPTRTQERVARFAGTILLVGFIGTLPFLNHQLPVVDPFIPIVDTALFLSDLITAAVLYAQFSILRSRGLLALATGYLFTALIIVPHLLTFPGAFSDTGLLAANLQSTAWLHVFWHLGLPPAAIAYALLKRHRDTPPRSRSSAPPIITSIVAVAVLVTGLTWLVTMGAEYLPQVLFDAPQADVIWHYYVAPPLLVVSLSSIVLMWKRRSSVLDLWVLVVLWAWLLEASLLALTEYRFTVAWYAGRVFGLVAGGSVLLAVLSELTVLYARLTLSVTAQEREREERRMTLEVIVGAIAHELNQPLTAVVMNAKAAMRFLNEGQPDLGETRAALQDIAGAGVRASQMIESTRTMLSGTAASADHVSIAQVVHETLALLRVELQMNSISLEVETPPGLPRVRGNRGELLQVMVNLITNAVESMAAVTTSTRLLRVIVAREGAAGVSLLVEDSGVGIDAANAGRLFDAFYTTKPHGRGLGLAICRAIIEAHGGKITAVPSRNHGAGFRVVLPSADANDSVLELSEAGAYRAAR